MRNRIEKKDQRFRRTLYRKSLLLVLIITCLPTLIIGIGIYYFGVSRIEKEVNHSNQLQLSQSTKVLDTYLTQVETLTVQWGFNAAFDVEESQSDLNRQYEDIWAMYRTLSNIRGSNPLIERVYLYLSETQTLVSSEEGIIPIKNQSLQTFFGTLLKDNSNLFWTDEIPPLSSNKTGVALVHKLPHTVGKPEGSLIVYIDQNRLAQLMKGVSNESQVDSFLYHEAGDWVLSLKNGKMGGADPTQKSLLVEALSDHKQSDAFIFNLNGQKYSLSYEKFSRTNSPWIYVTATSITQLTKPVAFLSRLIIGISLIALLLGALLSWLASRQLYEPIQRLLRTFGGVREAGDQRDEVHIIENRWRHLNAESESLKQQIDEHLPYLRESFLLQLLQGHLSSLTDKQLHERMLRFGWEPEGKRYSVLLVRLLDMTQGGRFREGDEHLVSFSAFNIVSELFAQKKDLDGCVINFQNMTMGLLVLVPSEWSSQQLRAEMYSFAEEIKSQMIQLLKLNVTQVIGKSTTYAHKVSEAFEEARHALGYRDLDTDNQIVDMEDHLPQTTQSYSYPFELERELLQTIRMGDEIETQRLFNNFVNELEAEGKELYVRQGMMQFLGSLQHAMLKWGYGSYDMDGLYEQWAQLREPKAMQKWALTKVIRPYWKEIGEVRSAQEKEMSYAVDKVLGLLQQQYNDDGLSLEWCADTVNVNPYTLSKAFKLQTGVNFIDYLTDLRLEKSRQLLADTDMKINDVATQVGYQPSYFNRIFKKHEGMTPSQYRQSLRSNMG